MKNKVTILSPHLDDAVLSLGQHLIKWKKEGKEVKIITIFTKFKGENVLPDYSINYLEKSGFKFVEDFEEARIAEDKNVMEKLEVEYEHWDFIDAGFRGRYVMRKALLNGKVNEKDRDLESRIKKKLEELSKSDLLLVPYGVGGHVDHLIVKRAAEKIKSKRYYLEIPYLYQNFNFIKMFVKILNFKSMMISGKEKEQILKGYRSQYGLIMKDRGFNIEIIL